MAWQRLQTDQLIEKLVDDLRPRYVESQIRTRRLWAIVIIVIAIPVLLLAKPLRADLAFRLADEMFLASFATSALVFGAGLSALRILRASWRSRGWLLMPAIAFGFWIVSELVGIAVDDSQEGWRAFAFESSVQCPIAIGFSGVPVFVVLLSLSRVGLILWRGPIIATAALSAFSLPATMLNLFHSLDSGAMVLLWHSGAVIFFSITASLVLHRRVPRVFCDWLGP